MHFAEIRRTKPAKDPDVWTTLISQGFETEEEARDWANVFVDCELVRFRTYLDGRWGVQTAEKTQ